MFCPEPRLGSLQRSPDPLAKFNGPRRETTGRKREERGGERSGREKRKGGEQGRGGEKRKG